MLSLRDLWRKHRKKILVTAGVLGSGYLLYKLSDARKHNLADLERELARERENDELIKAHVVEVSLKAVVDALVEDTSIPSRGDSRASGMPMAKLLPRIAQIGRSMVDEPIKNRFIKIIQSVPEVELFFTLLHANMPAS